jgi:hypothetical protein
MLKKLKKNSLKKNTEKNLTMRDVSQRNTALKMLGFLMDEAFFDDFELFYEFGKELGLQRKDIKIFTFIETRKKLPSLRQNQITNKEFSWQGDIHNQNANEFLDIPFDVLISFNKEKHEYLGAMAAQSKAKFKIGFDGADERLYDLVLAVDPQNTIDFKSEVRKYLKILKKI